MPRRPELGERSAPEEAEQAAVKLLAAREHSRAELVWKLGSKFPAELLEAVLDDLAQRGLLNDARYAEQYAGSRMRKGYGPVRIRHELRERGIDVSLADSVLDDVETDWYEQMREAHDRKYGRDIPHDRKELSRRARFLEYRGFPGEMIRELLFS